MNLLIENLNSSMFSYIDINIIKTLTGEFQKEDLESQLVNLYYNKVIIDITAIKNYFDYNYLFKFLSYFEKDKVILLLSGSDIVNSKEFISKLVEEGYYNFTKNVQGINYLLDHPNKLEDVEKFIVKNTFENPLFENRENVDITTINTDEVLEPKNPNQIIIGIQNLTEHAGSTTLMYMMVKQLRVNYNVQGIEMMKQDHVYFRDSDIIPSTSLEELKMKIKALGNKEAIIIDLNDVNGTDVCDTVLYLIDPGMIKLAKLMKSNRDLNDLMRHGKLVLNRSALRDEELSNFEYETKLKIFYNLGLINDRKERLQVIDSLLVKLGFKKQGKGRGIFG